jgi:hypothetical protein
MVNAQSKLLDVLKRELEFLNSSGYHRPSWRPQFVFQDSPTCMNRDNPKDPKPCSECVLMPFVPAESRKNKIPCRQIALNDQGNTIDDFYHWGTREELEDELAVWLATQIRNLESTGTAAKAYIGGNGTQRQASATAA